MKNRADHPAVHVVGIDVGGPGKGYHAVALSGGRYLAHLATKDVEYLSHWCAEVQRSQVVAVDAPCCWSKNGRARPAERALIERGIHCFSTPTRERAAVHPKGYFDWMLQGELIFEKLRDNFPLCSRWPEIRQRYCFETFPHAVSWQLRGGNALASQKRSQRRQLLREAGIKVSPLSNIDLVDAALCALTAWHAVSGKPCQSFGDGETGLIIVPEQADI